MMTPEDLLQIRQLFKEEVAVGAEWILQNQDKVAEALVCAISRHAEETPRRLASMDDRLDLLAVSLQSLETRVSVITKTLFDRAKSEADDRNAVVRLRGI